MRCIRCGTDGIRANDEMCFNCGAHLPSLFRDLLPPGMQLLGGTYEIEYALGRGGFGVTYRATQTYFDRSVAIKEFFPQDHAHREGITGSLITPSSSQAPYKRWLERFKREGQVLFDLHQSNIHPNIVRVQNLFEERSTAYLVMELLEGRTLQEEINDQKGKGLPEKRVVEIMDALVTALSQVHSRNLYHLDIKPSNVMITPEKRVVLLDFGAARQELSRSQIKTGKSSIAFSESYAPPELMTEGELSSASDLFELGMLLHELLTGKLPPSALSRFLQHKNWEPEVRSPWREMISSALTMDVSDRPQNVSAWWGRASRNADIKSKQKIKNEKESFPRFSPPIQDNPIDLKKDDREEGQKKTEGEAKEDILPLGLNVYTQEIRKAIDLGINVNDYYLQKQLSKLQKQYSLTDQEVQEVYQGFPEYEFPSVSGVNPKIMEPEIDPFKTISMIVGSLGGILILLAFIIL